jgi:hypothetical protein
MSAAPLTLPCDHDELVAIVRREWPGAARKHGVDPALLTLDVENGRPWATWVLGLGTDYVGLTPLVSRALDALADLLEDAGLAIDRSDDVLVLGWAAAEETVYVVGDLTYTPHPRRYRLIDAERDDPGVPVVKAWRERIFAERQARDSEHAGGRR